MSFIDKLQFPPNMKSVTINGRKFLPKDILAAEMIYQTTVVGKTKSGSFIGRALLGGALLGPLGALAGAVTAKTTAEEKVSRLGVAITVNDSVRPYQEVMVIDSKLGGIKVAASLVKWCQDSVAKLNVIIHNNKLGAGR